MVYRFKKEKNNSKIVAVNGIISVIIIAAVLYWAGVEKIFAELGRLDYFYLLLSVVFLLLMYAGMVVRIKILLKETRADASWLEILKAHMVGMLLADFTPARSGYFSTAAVLHYNYKVPSEKAMLSIFGPQIFDFILKVTVGTAAIFVILWQFLDGKNSWILLLGSFGVAFIIAIMLLLLFSKRFLNIFAFSKKLPFTNHFYELLERMQGNSRAVIRKTPHLIILLVYTWSMKAISWYFAAKSVGITIPVEKIRFPEVFFYFFLQPLITMLEFIPSPTLAGLGLSEGGTALVLSLFGISAAKATAFALITRFKTILVNLVAIPEALKMLKR